MNQWKAYATVAVVAALMIPATAAHAEKVWWDSLGGIDCDRETYFDTAPNGAIEHYPALAYEIESYCGVPATIVWTDDQKDGTPVFVEPLNPPAPAPVAAPAPVTVAPIAGPIVAPVQPAPVAEVIEAAPFKLAPRGGVFPLNAAV